MNRLTIRYCKRCVMPGMKPDRFIDEGICSGCRHIEQRKAIDWATRKDELFAVLDRFRCRGGGNYDCSVPVSGGKDSTCQTIRLLDLGLNPLCVTATTCMLSDIGRRNIENLKRQGVDDVELTPNPRVRRKLNRLGLMQVGDEFIKVCDRFTNKKLFVCDGNGKLLKDRDGNLTKVNYDNSGKPSSP